MSSAPINVKAACHCGLNTFNVAFPPPPASSTTDMCHCNMCRHTTGQMFDLTRTMAGMPLSLSGEPANLSKLIQYKSSPRLTRYSCSKCGAFMFDSVVDNGGDAAPSATPKWSVTAGVLDSKQSHEFIGIDHHAYIEDTLDGGFADHYPQFDDAELARFKTSMGRGDTIPRGWKADKILQIQDKPLDDNETLSFNCHCRAIDMYITPPPRSIADPENDWWLVPAGNEPNRTTSRPWVRYHALHCVCDSCRLTSGSVIQSWVYVPITNIIDKHTSKPITAAPAADGTPPTPGLRQYESSPRTFREFCGTCGATVFFWKTSRDPMVLDISAGLLDQEQEGARADRWFAWSREVEAREDAVDLKALKALEVGLKA